MFDKKYIRKLLAMNHESMNLKFGWKIHRLLISLDRVGGPVYRVRILGSLIQSGNFIRHP